MVGSSAKLEFLGVVIDSGKFEFSISQKRLNEIMASKVEKQENLYKM